MKLGMTQELIVAKQVDFGVYLVEEEGSDNRVLLPKKQVPAGTRIGDRISVFLYKDSSDRLIATTNRPKLELGQIALLKVVETGKIGAFMDWGLEKDLLLPFKEQTAKVKTGGEYPVCLYIDKSERLCATMHLYHHFTESPEYRKDDIVSGHVYEISKNFGVYVAVDDKYNGLIAPKEDLSSLKVGDLIEARVEKVKPDGKLDLTLRKKAYEQMDEDAERLMELIEMCGGALPFTDKADPQLIMEETGLSKNAFKRAVGRLYKERKIVITDTQIMRK